MIKKKKELFSEYFILGVIIRYDSNKNQILTTLSNNLQILIGALFSKKNYILIKTIILSYKLI